MQKAPNQQLLRNTRFFGADDANQKHISERTDKNSRLCHWFCHGQPLFSDQEFKKRAL